MALDQQALVEMFRQGFSPLADLSSGQLQMAIQQQQRDYTARQQQAQRAQAMQDHIAGLEAQARLQQAQQTQAQQAHRADIQEQARLQQENQRELERIRFGNDRTTTADRTASGLAQADMERYWRTLDKGDETLTDLRKIAAAQGLDTTEFKDPVSLTAALAGHVKKKTERLTNEATDLYLSLYDTEQALNEATAKTQLTEAEMVKIALPYALSAAGKDKDLRASLSKMTTVGEIATELASKVEASQSDLNRIADAIAIQKKSRETVQAGVIRQASIAADRINRQILDLPPGTTPDRAVLKKRGVPAPVARGVSVEDQALNDAEMDSLFQPAAGAVAPPSVTATPSVGAGWGFLGDAARMAVGGRELARDAVLGAGRKAVDAGRFLMRAPPVLARAVVGDNGVGLLKQLGENAPQTRLAVKMFGPSASDFVRPRPSFTPASLGGLMDQGVTIDSLINRAQDPTLAGQFRAMRADPMGEPGIEDALAQIFGSGSTVLDQAPPAWQY